MDIACWPKMPVMMKMQTGSPMVQIAARSTVTISKQIRTTMVKVRPAKDVNALPLQVTQA
jgi:hypothetical protein